MCKHCHYLNNFAHNKHITKATIHTAWSACKLWRCCWCCSATNNFVSLNTVHLKTQTSHTAGFEITLKTTDPLGVSNDLPWGGYGLFLELQNTAMWDSIHWNTTQKTEQHGKPQCPPPCTLFMPHLSEIAVVFMANKSR